jgi:ATP-dependent DNA helicase RecQ
LQAYFGEEPGEACGICDNCLKQKQPRTDPDAEPLRQQILHQFTADGLGLSPRQLADRLGVADEALADVIRQMLTDDELRIDAAGNLYLSHTMNWK